VDSTTSVTVADGVLYAESGPPKYSPRAERRAECAGCGGRFRRHDVVEVQDSLTYHAGDLLCSECRHGSDAVVL
jgi:hypothetical protein